MVDHCIRRATAAGFVAGSTGFLWSAGILDGSWLVALSTLFVAYATWRLRNRAHELGLALVGSGSAALLLGPPSMESSASSLPLIIPLLIVIAGATALLIVRIDRGEPGPLLSEVDPNFVFESNGVQFVVLPPQGPISRTSPGHLVAWAINVMSTSRTVQLEPEEGREDPSSAPQLRFAAADPVSLQPGEGVQVVMEVTPCPTIIQRHGYVFAAMRVGSDASEGAGVRTRIRQGCSVQWPSIAHRQGTLSTPRGADKASWFGHQVELTPEPFVSPPGPRTHVRVLSGDTLTTALQDDLRARLATRYQSSRNRNASPSRPSMVDLEAGTRYPST